MPHCSTGPVKASGRLCSRDSRLLHYLYHAQMAPCLPTTPRVTWRCATLSLPPTTGQPGKRPDAPTQARPRLPSGVQGAQPPPGVQRVPLYPETSEGGQVGQRRRPKQTLRRRRAQAKTNPSAQVMPHPPCKIRTIVLRYPHEVGHRPASLSRSLPHMFGQGDSLWTPPVAGALREQPKGQDPPRKAGTGANAVVKHRLFGAIPLRNDS